MPLPVEFAHHTDALGIGRPGGEDHTVNAIDGLWVGAEETIGVQVGALGEQVHVEVAELWAEAVGVDALVAVAGIVNPGDGVGPGQRLAVTAPQEQVGLLIALHGVPALQRDLFRPWLEYADDVVLAHLMAAEDFEGIVVAGLENLADL